MPDQNRAKLPPMNFPELRTFRMCEIVHQGSLQGLLYGRTEWELRGDPRLYSNVTKYKGYKLLIGVSRERSGSGAMRAMPLQPGLDTIHVDVNDRRREESEHLAKDKTADNGDTERAAKF